MELIYHITHIDNLEQIFDSGALISKNRIIREYPEHISIAYETLQQRRQNTIIPLPPNGVLHDYVPFYFAARSPMLYTIDRGNVESYTDGQEKIVHFVLKIADIITDNIDFVFTDGHPIVALSQFYNNPEELQDKVDWEVMQSRYWSDTPQDPDKKRRRQAEFLIYDQVPVNLINGIGVFDQNIQNEVNCLIERFQPDIDCKVKRNWYY